MPIYCSSTLRMTPTDSTGSFPADTEGAIYYDDSESLLKHYDGSNWGNVNTNVRDVLSLNATATNEYINLGDTGNATYEFMENGDAQSVSIWFKSAVNATQCVFSINDDTGGHHNFIIFTTAGNLKVVHVASGEINDVTYATTYQNQWYHVIWAISASPGDGTTTSELFVNGTSRGTDSASTTNRSDAPQDLAHIGRYAVASDDGTWTVLTGTNTAGQQFSGLVSNVSIWDTKINASNALAIYNGGTPQSDLTAASGNYNVQANLQGWWKLDGDYTDSSGNSRHGAVGVGTPSFASVAL